MYTCDSCGTSCARRLRFPECGHAICTTCFVELVWTADEHFLCCQDPSCVRCHKRSDIVVENYGQPPKTIYEKSLSDSDTEPHNDGAKDDKKSKADAAESAHCPCR